MKSAVIPEVTHFDMRRAQLEAQKAMGRWTFGNDVEALHRMRMERVKRAVQLPPFDGIEAPVVWIHGALHLVDIGVLNEDEAAFFLRREMHSGIDDLLSAPTMEAKRKRRDEVIALAKTAANAERPIEAEEEEGEAA